LRSGPASASPLLRKPEVTDFVELIFAWPEFGNVTWLVAEPHTAKQVIAKSRV
jgi:hypothetical protein